MEKQRSNYTDEEEIVIEKRAIEYMQKKPNASRTRVAIYAGVGVAVLERLEKNGNFKLPKPMTSKQVRKTNKDWGIF
jgi:hypothetical protein|tara:strand:+ start:159 stop:389 length:231 start_codon:yes stop_codon:yes gene_type:complete